jgi:hypothetical protein
MRGRGRRGWAPKYAASAASAPYPFLLLYRATTPVGQHPPPAARSSPASCRVTGASILSVGLACVLTAAQAHTCTRPGPEGKVRGEGNVRSAYCPFAPDQEIGLGFGPRHRFIAAACITPNSRPVNSPRGIKSSVYRRRCVGVGVGVCDHPSITQLWPVDTASRFRGFSTTPLG